MHKPLKTNGQSHEDTWPLKTNRDFLSRDEGKAGVFSAPAVETNALPCAHIRYEDWMKWFDSETLASFKSYACWAFFKCTARLII